MRKITVGCIYAFLFLWISSIVTVILRDANSEAAKETAVHFVIAALVIVAVVGTLYYILHKWVCHGNLLKILCFGFNAIALGIAMTGWYIDRGFYNPLWMMTLICLCAVAYLLVMYGILQIPFVREKISKLTVILLLIFSLIGYIILVICTKTTYVSTYGFYCIIAVSFFFALILPQEDEDDILSHMLVATYSVIAVAILMLIIIGGGDGLDFDLDLGFGSSDNKKKK